MNWIDYYQIYEGERLAELKTHCDALLLNFYECNEKICEAANNSEYSAGDIQRRFLTQKMDGFEWDLSCPNFWAAYDYYKYKG